MALAPVPRWRRLRLDLALLAVAAIAQAAALATGAFDAPSGSVYSGRAVSLPGHLLLAPLVAWLGGTLLAVRVFAASAERLRVPAPPRFGPVLRGTLIRSLKRRSAALGTGIIGVGLVLAFGVGLAVFAASYDAAKGADAAFVVGSDLRITPSVLSPDPHTASFASSLEVSGVAAVTPVVFSLENSVLIGPDNQDRQNLAAIDPVSFERVAPLSDSLFVDGSAGDAMSELAADPRGLLVQAQTADDLSVEANDLVQVLLARGTDRQLLETFRVVGVFADFPAFPQGADLVVDLNHYEAATGLRRVDFFLARTADHHHQGLARAEAALRSGPGERDPLDIDSRETALHKDQSSLTALNVNGLVDLSSLYTVVMTAAAIGIFVFGLMLARRREYVTQLAHGMSVGQLRALVLGEALLVAVCGLAAGLVVGTAMAQLMVHILRPLFILDPGVTVPISEIATLAALTLAATLTSSLAGAAILSHLEPAELLREA